MDFSENAVSFVPSGVVHGLGARGTVRSPPYRRRFSGARVVKAFNHLQPNLLSGHSRAEGVRRVLFHSGDDAGSRAAVGALIDRLGFFGIDLGPISIGGPGPVPRRTASGPQPREVG